MIPENALQCFDEAIKSAFRLRNSLLAELLLIVLIYIVGVLLSGVSTWRFTPPVGRTVETAARNIVLI